MNYPRAFRHIGDHILARRLDLKLQMKEVAKFIGVHPSTIKNWERNKTNEPIIKHWPQIIRFLGYCPYIPCPTLPEKMLMYRKTEGISQAQMAIMIGIDPGTLEHFEKVNPISSKCQDRILSYYAQNITI